MFIKQISVFLENKKGRLAEVVGALADNGINIEAMSIGDTSDFGILRLIVDKPEAALDCVKAGGFTVKMTNVVAVSIENKPGGLFGVLKKLEENDISIEYSYDYMTRADDRNTVIILRLNNSEDAVARMEKAGIQIVKTEELRNLR